MFSKHVSRFSVAGLRLTARLPADGAVTARLRRAPIPRRLGWGVLLLLAFAALATLRFAMTTGAFRNSDDASNFLAGVEMAEGNWRLHGWIMAPDNYYPTEVLGQAVLRLLFGYHPVLMQGLEALVWAAVGVVGTALAAFGARSRHLPGIISIALALLAFNIFAHQFRDVFLSTVAAHSFTILLTLLSFALVATADATLAETLARSPVRQAASLGLVLTVGSFADPIFNVIACLPILAVSLLGIGAQGRTRPLLLRIGTVIGAVLLARLLLSLNAHNGGFTSVRLSISLASFPDVAGHLVFAVESIARVLGMEFFGHSLDETLAAGPAISLLRAPLLLALAVAVWEVGRDVLRRVRRWPAARLPRRGADLDQLLWISLVLCIVSTSMTTIITDPSCARFFIPAAVMGSVLTARRFGRVPLVALYGMAVMVASLVIAVLAVPPGWPQSTVTIPQEPTIVAALRQHGLQHGYAGYWESTMTTAISNRSITSLALVEGGDHRLHTLNWFCNLDWFRTAARDWHGRIFFIVTNQVGPGPLELTPDMVASQFGRPIETVNTGQFSIEIYNVAGRELEALVP